MSETTTRERILDAAEEIMLEKSFHSVGLNEILKSVGVPKGSFYHHFESKEQFGVELLRHYSGAANAHRRRILLSAGPEADPRARLLTLLESNIASFLENSGKCPCLIVKLASEVSNFSESMREVLRMGQQEWASIVEQGLREGMEKGRIAQISNPANSAVLINCLWMGAIHEATIARSAEPLRCALNHIATHLVPAS